MQCPTCNYPSSMADNYCRRCGAPLTATRLPVRRPIHLPVSWRPTPVAIRSGLLALAVGAGLELLRRRLVGRLARSASRLPSILTSRLPSPETSKDDDNAAYSLTETIILQRSWMRWMKPREPHRTKK